MSSYTINDIKYRLPLFSVSSSVEPLNVEHMYVCVLIDGCNMTQYYIITLHKHNTGIMHTRKSHGYFVHGETDNC